ncbi:MAG: hypothetical protein AAFX39_00460 [Pseudomonadota bacterium]
MMRDLIPPLFQILGGLTMMTFLVVNLRLRAILSGLNTRLQFALIACIGGGLLFMGFGTAERSLGAAGPALIGAAAFFFVAAICVVAGLFLTVGREAK